MELSPLEFPTSREVRLCIFCGGIGSTNDHIVPLALGGLHILRNSSCETCRDRLNKNIDQPVLKGFLHSPRLLYDLPRSRKRPADTETRVLLAPAEGGEAVNLKVPISHSQKLMIWAGFGRPRILYPAPAPKDGTYRITNLFSYNPGEITSYSMGGQPMAEMHPIEDYILFIRMLAKTAHTLAYLALAPSAFTPVLLDFIEGRTDDPTYLTGNLSLYDNAPRTDRYYDLKIAYMGKYVVASVQIFSHLGMPYYDFVVGLRSGHAVFA